MGRCNTRYSFSDLEGVVHGTDWTSWAFCEAEGGAVATLEKRRVVECDRSRARQACGVGVRGTEDERLYIPSASLALPPRAEHGRTRRDLTRPRGGTLDANTSQESNSLHHPGRSGFRAWK